MGAGNGTTEPRDRYYHRGIRVGNPHNLATKDVDGVADELVQQCSNPGYRGWYCKGIYALGFKEIAALRRRAAGSDDPCTLFSKLLGEALRDYIDSHNPPAARKALEIQGEPAVEREIAKAAEEIFPDTPEPGKAISWQDDIEAL